MTRIAEIACKTGTTPSGAEFRNAWLKALRPLVKVGNATEWQCVRVAVQLGTGSHIAEHRFHALSDAKLDLASFALDVMHQLLPETKGETDVIEETADASA